MTFRKKEKKKEVVEEKQCGKLLAWAPRHGRHFSVLITAIAEETCGCKGKPMTF